MTPDPRRRGSSCIGDRVPDLVAGALDTTEQRVHEHHLIACATCRQEVEAERRLQFVLRGAPDVPGDLRAALLTMTAGADGDHREQRRPPVGIPAPLPVLAPDARACHRSALRSTVVAAAAAGACVAAAWTLGATAASEVEADQPSVLPRPVSTPFVVSSPAATAGLTVPEVFGAVARWPRYVLVGPAPTRHPFPPAPGRPGPTDVVVHGGTAESMP